MTPLLWSLARTFIQWRRGRRPPPALQGPVWYFAYGSNMNEWLFRKRRHMVWQEARVAWLADHRLVFTRAGGRYPGLSAPANIVEAPGERVYGVIYLLPLRKFARLDNSEGKQYAYVWTQVEDVEGNPVPAVTYKVAGTVAEGPPSRQYLDLLREAARQRELPPDYLAFLDAVETRP